LLVHAKTDEAARWLGSLPGELQTRSDVRLARADCLMALHDWDGLKAMLEGADWGGSEFFRHALLARVYRENNAATSAQADWLQAARLAAGDARALTTLARLTTSWKWQRELEEVLWTLVQRFPGEQWALRALSEAYLEKGNTLGLHKIYEELVKRDSNDRIARNNLAVTSLLLHLQTERAHDLARSVYLQKTNDAIGVSTYAYSLYLQGRSHEGLAVLQALPPSDLEKPSVALYLGVLQATNDSVEARKYLDLAAAGPLLPEEKALLELARKQL